MASSLVQLYQAVQGNDRIQIDAYEAALDQQTANARLDAMGTEKHFKTFYRPDAFGGWRVMLGLDLAEVMYGRRDIDGLRKLLQREGLELLDIGTSGHDVQSIKAHFGLSRNTSQQSFATWIHFLRVGMKGETPLARQVGAYLIATEREERIQEAARHQGVISSGMTVNDMVAMVGQSIATYVPQLIAAQVPTMITAQIEPHIKTMRQADENLRIALEREREARERDRKEIEEQHQRDKHEWQQQIEAIQTVAAGPTATATQTGNSVRDFVWNRAGVLKDLKGQKFPIIFIDSYEHYMCEHFKPFSTAHKTLRDAAWNQEDLLSAYNTSGFGTDYNRDKSGDERLLAELADINLWYERQTEKRQRGFPRAVKSPRRYTPGSNPAKDPA